MDIKLFCVTIFYISFYFNVYIIFKTSFLTGGKNGLDFSGGKKWT
jgi:hypothetical protein